jgi:integrase
MIIDYLLKMDSPSNRTMMKATLHLFYDMNDVTLNWKKVGKYMGETVAVKKTRAYNHEEIKKLVDVSDIRFKAIILLLASTGIRIGAIPALEIRNLERVENIYKVTVYENSKEEYITFCTSECSNAIDEYLEYRSRNGEKITQESPLFRLVFQFGNIQRQRIKGITLIALNNAFENLRIRIGLSERDHVNPFNRKAIARYHGFRKFFTTQLVNSKVNPEIREMLLGHKIGLASAYYRPSEEEILTEYEKAIDALTINPENRLKRRVEKLEVERSQFDQLAAKIASLERKIR